VRIPVGNSTYVITQRDVALVTGRGLLGRRKLPINSAAARPFIGVAALSGVGPGVGHTTIQPFGTARGIATLDPQTAIGVKPEKDAAYIGVSVDGDAAHGRFKTVTLGWNLADTVNAKHTARVLKKVMKKFGVKRHTYRVKSKQPVIYHSSIRDQSSGRATTITATVMGGKGKPKVKLFYRRHGQGKFYKVTMKKAGKDHAANFSYVATIPGRAFTPDGVEYYIKAGKTVDPYGTKRNPLYHGIAVAMPMIPDPLPIKR